MSRRMSRSLCAAVTFALLGGAGCSDYSPWPPQGGVREGVVTERQPEGLPKGQGEGAPKSLLAQSLEEGGVPQGEELMTLSLPRQSKGLVYAALQRAAKDDLDGLLEITADAAAWGLPVTSELESVLVSRNPEQYIDAMRDVGSRLSAQADFRCAPVMPPALETYVKTGAEPMWCSFTSGDRHDILLFKLRMIEGRGQIEYMGMFNERPEGPVRVASSEPPPPPVPPVDRTATNDDYTFRDYKPAPKTPGAKPAEGGEKPAEGAGE